jgi:hypothetical protein
VILPGTGGGDLIGLYQYGDPGAGPDPRAAAALIASALLALAIAAVALLRRHSAFGRPSLRTSFRPVVAKRLAPIRPAGNVATPLSATPALAVDGGAAATLAQKFPGLVEKQHEITDSAIPAPTPNDGTGAAPVRFAAIAERQHEITDSTIPAPTPNDGTGAAPVRFAAIAERQHEITDSTIPAPTPNDGTGAAPVRFAAIAERQHEITDSAIPAPTPGDSRGALTRRFASIVDREHEVAQQAPENSVAPTTIAERFPTMTKRQHEQTEPEETGAATHELGGLLALFREQHKADIGGLSAHAAH